MPSTPTANTAEQIVEEVGGPDNIIGLTHCATRLRFELKDASLVDQAAIEKIPGVMGAVPQSGDRFQVVIGGGVQTTYTEIMGLPQMAQAGRPSDAEVKAAARAKAKGKAAWIDNFFEYLSDSFRPLLGVLLGASLIIAIASMLDALNVIDFQAADRPATWVFWDAMAQSVFYFLPIMVAYNAAKKLDVDPWVGATIMGALMTPQFLSLSGLADTVCTPNPSLGTETCVASVFGLPMPLSNYGGQVFVPLIMVALLAVWWRLLKRIFPETVQLVFVPFFAMLVMIPITAFLIGPLGVWMGNSLGSGLAWLNSNAPLVFAILIPLLYPFLVPLGLHWPLNALMLVNINTLGYDFIQGPMGSWNFACFGATAGVLVLSLRDRDTQMRQTATGALAAGLLGGISEPSLYGIHLRFKRIYPRMLVGCLVGGLITGLLGGVTTETFAFTSLLTIPVFNPIWVYALAITAAFVTAMALVIISDYRTPEQRAEFLAQRDLTEAEHVIEEAEAGTPAHAVVDTGGAVTTMVKTRTVAAPVSGRVIPLEQVADAVFASKALGEGVGIVPTEGHVTAPVEGTLVTVPDTGHAFGLKTDDGVEVLVHVGIDTVQLNGAGFQVAVKPEQRVVVGDLLGRVDLDAVKGAGYDPTTMVVVVNSAALTSVTPKPEGQASAGDPVIDVEP